MVTDPVALSAFTIRPVGLPDSIRHAIRYEDRALAQTRWSDARSSGGGSSLPAETRCGSKLVDARQMHVAVDADRAFVPIAGIGGTRGWYFGTWLWRIRDTIDLLMGGVGMRRGRRDPESVAVGDILDFWRVEAHEPGRRLRLAAEMTLPGRHRRRPSVPSAAGRVPCRRTPGGGDPAASSHVRTRAALHQLGRRPGCLLDRGAPGHTRRGGALLPLRVMREPEMRQNGDAPTT